MGRKATCLTQQHGRGMALDARTFNCVLETWRVCCRAAGIGKSTLLNLIGGTLEPTSGYIERNTKANCFSAGLTDQPPTAHACSVAA